MEIQPQQKQTKILAFRELTFKGEEASKQTGKLYSVSDGDKYQGGKLSRGVEIMCARVQRKNWGLKDASQTSEGDIGTLGISTEWKETKRENTFYPSPSPLSPRPEVPRGKQLCLLSTGVPSTTSGAHSRHSGLVC